MIEERLNFRCACGRQMTDSEIEELTKQSDIGEEICIKTFTCPQCLHRIGYVPSLNPSKEYLAIHK